VVVAGVGEGRKRLQMVIKGRKGMRVKRVQNGDRQRGGEGA
jgi:hypothetical protein